MVLMILGISLMTSCKKDPITGSVSGVVTVYDPSSPLVKTSLEGIKLFLVVGYRLSVFRYFLSSLS